MGKAEKLVMQALRGEAAALAEEAGPYADSASGMRDLAGELGVLARVLENVAGSMAGEPRVRILWQQGDS